MSPCSAIYQEEIEAKVSREYRLAQINKRLTELNKSLKIDVENAFEEGISVTEWRMQNRLRRNQEMQETMGKDWNRVQARKITSPMEQKRGQLLDMYLDQVLSSMVYK